MKHVIGKVRRPGARRSNTICAPMARSATDGVRRILRGASLQAKLEVGAIKDRYEQEADRAAEQVMRMPASHGGMHSTLSVDGPKVQRMCAKCEEEVRRQPMTEEEELRTKRDQGSAPLVGADLQARVGALRGQGQPLHASIRHFFEPRFGRRFDQVRVHKDERATALAKSLHARAFAFGNDIAFAANEFRPDTGRGKKLLAHELTHVVQQSGGRQAAIQRAGPEQPEAGEEGFRRAPPRVPLGQGFTKTDCKTNVNDVFFLSSLFVDGARPECSFAQIMELPDLTNTKEFRAAYSLEGKPKCESGDEANEFWLRVPNSEWKIVKINASNSVTVVNPCGEEQVLYEKGARRPAMAPVAEYTVDVKNNNFGGGKVKIFEGGNRVVFEPYDGSMPEREWTLTEEPTRSGLREIYYPFNGGPWNDRKDLEIMLRVHLKGESIGTSF